jgi:uncharacterized membrane protein
MLHQIYSKFNKLVKMNYLEILKPKLPKRYLLFLAAAVWTFAGGMLLFKGAAFMRNVTDYVWLRVIISAIGGALFYVVLFSKISLKHTHRIINLKSESPCLFSFFNIRSYILMGIMITSGVLLRKSGIIAMGYLSMVYRTMGIPLFLSAFRFYYFGIYFNTVKKTVKQP